MGTLALGSSLFAQQTSGGQQMSAESQTWPGHVFENGLLNGRVAVVTGAARGIGRAIAVDMAANGADIVAIDICSKILPRQDYAVTSPEDLQETGRLVQERGENISP